MAQLIEKINSMEKKTDNKKAVRSEAISVLLSASAGAGIGWIIWLTMGNIAVALGMAGPIAALSNNFLRKVIK